MLVHHQECSRSIQPRFFQTENTCQPWAKRHDQSALAMSIVHGQWDSIGTESYFDIIFLHVCMFCLNYTWVMLSVTNGRRASIGRTHADIVVPRFFAPNGPKGTYSHFCISLAVKREGTMFNMQEAWISDNKTVPNANHKYLGCHNPTQNSWIFFHNYNPTVFQERILRFTTSSETCTL